MFEKLNLKPNAEEYVLKTFAAIISLEDRTARSLSITEQLSNLKWSDGRPRNIVKEYDKEHKTLYTKLLMIEDIFEINTEEEKKFIHNLYDLLCRSLSNIIKLEKQVKGN